MNNAGLSSLARNTQEPPISWLMQLTLERPELISLAAGFTDNDSLPVGPARKLLTDLLGSRRHGKAALQYGSTPGDPDLRGLTTGRVRQLDHAATDGAYRVDKTLITHGSQQLLYLVTECLCDPGDIVLVEDPTYFVYLGILQSRGIQARTIPLREDGLDIAQLQRTLEALQKSGELKRVKLLYLVSYYQNPSGVTTSLEKKRAALDLLRHFESKAGHPIYLLEDAAYRELRFTGPDVPSALTLPEAERRVIYAGTYSKPFATGVRVGFGIAPEPLATALRRVKGNQDFGTSNLLQQLLSRALATGAYEKHLVTLRARYARKAKVMTQALRQHVPSEVAWQVPQGGLYVWARVPARVKTGFKSQAFTTALEKGVLYVPGQLCFADDPARRKPNSEMRLSYGGAALEDIPEGVARLGAVLRACL